MIEKDKVIWDFTQWKKVMEREWDLFKDEWKISKKAIFHYYVDLYVESMRVAPYTFGHIAAIAVPLMIIWGLV